MASSRVKDFITFLGSVKGDLANITSPPYFLAPESVLEVATCYTERPSLYIAPALEPDPLRRAMLIAKWVLAARRRYFYISPDTKTGIKKPLNAFLGEVWFGKWTDNTTSVKVVTEQVSHHPPISACYMADENYRIWGTGYSRVEMTFSGNLNVKQYGHAIMHLEEYDEHHLLQAPDVKVKGFLSGTLYPEIIGTYYVVSSSGIVTEMVHSGQGFFSGERNHVEGRIYRRDDPVKKALYTISGQWSGKFSIFDGKTGELVESWDPEVHPPAQLEESALLEDQDPWESRRAWRQVISALKVGDLSKAVKEKMKVEEAQRVLRKENPSYVESWEPLLFSASHGPHPMLEELMAAIPGWTLDAERTKGVWTYDCEKEKVAKKPYHDGLRPC